MSEKITYNDILMQKIESNQFLKKFPKIDKTVVYSELKQLVDLYAPYTIEIEGSITSWHDLWIDRSIQGIISTHIGNCTLDQVREGFLLGESPIVDMRNNAVVEPLHSNYDLCDEAEAKLATSLSTGGFLVWQDMLGIKMNNMIVAYAFQPAITNTGIILPGHFYSIRTQEVRDRLEAFFISADRTDYECSHLVDKLALRYVRPFAFENLISEINKSFQIKSREKSPHMLDLWGIAVDRKKYRNLSIID